MKSEIYSYQVEIQLGKGSYYNIGTSFSIEDDANNMVLFIRRELPNKKTRIRKTFKKTISEIIR